MHELEITFLGTGTSVGVPSIGCHCEVCESSDLKDKRLRSSILIKSTEGSVLVDCGPDLSRLSLRSEDSQTSQ
jgi:phosphoribosyl 1,2-cyclic phosphate phosphodiesterase